MAILSFLDFVSVWGFTLVLAIAAVGKVWYRQRQRRQEEKVFAEAHGCLPVNSFLPYKWPLSLDLLKKQYDALPSKRLMALWTEYFDKLEPTFSVHFFGVTGYATLDPQNVETINRTRFKDWCLGSRRAGIMPLLGEGIFTQDDKSWQHSRELVSRQFRRTHYYELETLREHVETMISNLAGATGTIDLQPEFYQFTLSTTTHLLFGETIGSLGRDVQKKFCEDFDYASEVTALRTRLSDVCWLYSPRKFTKACADIKQYADYFVQKALKAQETLGIEKASETYPFILDLYSEYQDPARVRDQLINILIAGRDTTAYTLGWFFFNAVRHPHVLDKLREEIRATVGTDTEFSIATIRKMTYLRAVLDEILRLYPQVPVNVRFSTRTTLLPRGGGPDGQSPLLIPKGTGVATAIYHMHRRTDLYGQDACSFRPERWLTGELNNIGSAYVAFHSGPRTCLGKEFAITEALYLIIRLIQTYPDIRLPDGVEVEPVGMERQNLSILISSADGCKVVLK